MPGAGRLTFSAGQVLTAAQVQDYLQDQAVMNFSGTAARATGIPTPSAGMVTHIGGGTVQVYNGTAWVALGGVPLASVTSTTGSPSITSDSTYTYYKFTASGSITFGHSGNANVDLMCVSSGGGGGTGNAINKAGGGGAGGMVEALGFTVTAKTYTITVAAGGATATAGSQSSVTDLLTNNGGRPGNGPNAGGGNSGNGFLGGAGEGAGGGATGTPTGRTNSLSGASTTYATGGPSDSNASGTANTGNGGGGSYTGAGGAGGSGVVIFRIPK